MQMLGNLATVAVRC